MVPMRRGYAGSDGASIADDSGSCDNANHSKSAEEASIDVAAVIKYIKGLSYANSNKILLVGVSTGGLTALATASLNVDGVQGAINFAGGRGGKNAKNISGFACNEPNLI